MNFPNEPNVYCANIFFFNLVQTIPVCTFFSPLQATFMSAIVNAVKT